DASVVDKAAQSAQSVSSLDECTNVVALSAPVPPPPGRDAAAKLAEARAQLAHTRALLHARRFAEAIPLAQSTLEVGRGLGYLPLEAQALYALGTAQDGLGEIKPGAATLREALSAAESGRHDGVKARVLAGLVWIEGYEVSDRQAAHMWGNLASATLKRIGGDDDAEALLC